MRVVASPHGVYVTRNLTGDPATGLGRRTEDQIINAIRNGRARDRVLNIWGMPWMFLHSLRDDDARAIARYLKSLPPIHNRIPSALHYGGVETIVAKLTSPLPAVSVTILTYADGNFGRQSGGLPRDLPQPVLMILQWLVLIVGVITFRRTPTQSRPRRLAFRALSALGVLGLVLPGLIGWAIYALPALRIIPPEQIALGITRGIPTADPAALKSPEQTALAERGRYLYTVASCAFCHQDGGGGAKISWAPFGTLWVRNISSDPETGIGKWSEAEIARAIRSGITRDGRVLHWQGMIWDHASNWDEEVLRSLIVYLRALPPVRRQIPPTRPPAPDDCAIYTFWVARSGTPGCR
jgi:cytochrome c553